MRSHRLALTTVSLAAALLAAGCGTGRETPDFGAGTPDGTAGAVQAAPSTPIVVAGPDKQVLAQRDAATAAAAREHDAAARAEARRRAARHQLREERAKADRAHRRAAARERALRRALAAKAEDRLQAGPSSAPAPAPAAPSAPISASDVGASDLAAERDQRSNAEARAAVVRFHELLDARDAHACLMLTPHLLHELYGDGDDAGIRCAYATRAINSDVSAEIAESTAHGRRAAVAVVSRMGDAEVAQTLRLVLVDGTWLIDAVERKPAS